MESKSDASGMDFPATDDPWFDELQEVLLASAASSENKVEGKYKEDGIMQWSISFTRDILSSAGISLILAWNVSLNCSSKLGMIYFLHIYYRRRKPTQVFAGIYYHFKWSETVTGSTTGK